MIKITIIEIRLLKVMWQRLRGKRSAEELMKGLKTEGAKYLGGKDLDPKPRPMDFFKSKTLIQGFIYDGNYH